MLISECQGSQCLLTFSFSHTDRATASLNCFINCADEGTRGHIRLSVSHPSWMVMVMVMMMHNAPGIHMHLSNADIAVRGHPGLSTGLEFWIICPIWSLCFFQFSGGQSSTLDFVVCPIFPGAKWPIQVVFFEGICGPQLTHSGVIKQGPERVFTAAAHRKRRLLPSMI